jgi:hypothetical protein
MREVDLDPNDHAFNDDRHTSLHDCVVTYKINI